MSKESYAKSIEGVVIENNIKKCGLKTLKKLVLNHREANNLLRDDDFEDLKTREPHKKWEHRIHGGLQSLKKRGDVSFLCNNEYEFFF